MLSPERRYWLPDSGFTSLIGGGVRDSKSPGVLQERWSMSFPNGSWLSAQPGEARMRCSDLLPPVCSLAPSLVKLASRARLNTQMAWSRWVAVAVFILETSQANRPGQACFMGTAVGYTCVTFAGVAVGWCLSASCP